MTAEIVSAPEGGIARILRRAWAWWLAELAQLLPPRIAGVFGREEEPGLLLRVGAGEPALVVTDRRRAGPSVISLAGCDAEERRARVRSALKPGRAPAAVIGLAAGTVLATEIELPLAALAALRQILRHQIERLVPLDPGEVQFDYRVLPRAADAKTVGVRVFIAKSAAIDRALGLARDCGLDPRLVIAADDAGIGDPPVFWRAPVTGAGHRRLCRYLEAAALVLLASAYGVYLHRLDADREALQARLAATNAAAVLALADEAERAEAAAAFLDQRRRETRPLPALDALTGLVPADSWLTRVALRGRAVEISGLSPHASNLVARVEASAFFENPHFRSPITLAPDGARERFELRLDIRPERAR